MGWPGTGWESNEEIRNFSKSSIYLRNNNRKLLEIRQDYQRETQTIRFEMQKKQLELRQLWSASTLNRSAIEAKEKEVTGLRVQLVTKARAMRDKMKNILTAEQLKKLEENGFNRNPGAGVRGRRGGGRMGCSCGA